MDELLDICPNCKNDLKAERLASTRIGEVISICLGILIVLISFAGGKGIEDAGSVFMILVGLFLIVAPLLRSSRDVASNKNSSLDKLNDDKKIEVPPDSTTVASSKNLALDKLGAYVTELPGISDEGINNMLQQLQNPMAYIRESALNDISRTKIVDPRIIGAIEILATSDRVDSIRDIAKRTLSILSKESNA